jgi:hypothetical protein
MNDRKKTTEEMIKVVLTPILPIVLPNIKIVVRWIKDTNASPPIAITKEFPKKI